jgi:hypothetical protein
MLVRARALPCRGADRTRQSVSFAGVRRWLLPPAHPCADIECGSKRRSCRDPFPFRRLPTDRRGGAELAARHRSYHCRRSGRLPASCGRSPSVPETGTAHAEASSRRAICRRPRQARAGVHSRIGMASTSARIRHHRLSLPASHATLPDRAAPRSPEASITVFSLKTPT